MASTWGLVGSSRRLKSSGEESGYWGGLYIASIMTFWLRFIFLGVGGGGGFSHVVDGFYDDIPGEGGAGGYLWTFGAVLFVVVVYHVDVPTVQQPEPALLNSEVPQVALEAIHALLIKADLPSPTQRSVWHCILNTNWLSISIQSCRIHGIFISRRGGIPSRNILYDDSACTSPTGTI